MKSKDSMAVFIEDKNVSQKENALHARFHLDFNYTKLQKLSTTIYVQQYCASRNKENTETYLRTMFELFFFCNLRTQLDT